MFKATETASASGSTLTAGNEDHQAGLNLNAGFGHSFGSFHLAGEVAFTSQIGEVTAQLGGFSFTDSLEEAITLSVLPGYKFGPNSLGFVRVGAAQAKLKAEGGPSQTHSGIVFGIGVKQAVSRNLAVSLEYQNYDLEEKDGLTPRSTGVVLGVQFAFR